MENVQDPTWYNLRYCLWNYRYRTDDTDAVSAGKGQNACDGGRLCHLRCNWICYRDNEAGSSRLASQLDFRFAGRAPDRNNHEIIYTDLDRQRDRRARLLDLSSSVGERENQ